jgi:acetyl esterase/lipase
MYRFAQHCAELGMVGISVQYRLYKPGTDATVFDCVKDARSAVRYVRAHAAELGIDPQKIILNGASAGGHLAAATAMLNFDETGEDTLVSCVPNALVLFSPVIDTSKEGYGNAKVGARWEELSPAHQVRPGVPRTIVFHGTADTTTPFQGAQLFHDAMLRAGNRSELVKVEGAGHTYMFKDKELYNETLRRLDAFFASLGFIASSARP